MAIRFGVIFIDNNIDNFFNDRRKTKQQLIRSILERKSGLDFIRFIEATAAKKFYCSVCYCENINTQKIEWISTNHSDFGEILQEFSDITSLSPNELPQFLANFKFIDNIFDINASYCFITPEDLKNLKERLFIQQDIDITHVINQKKGEAFDHILINDIKYNLLDNTFHFIFNVGNSLLKESSQLIIEVPREALDLENVDRLIENTLSSHRVCFCSEIHSVCSENSLICHLNQGSYIIDLHLIDD